MKKASVFLFSMVVLMLVIAGCSKKQFEPVPIMEGVDRCVVCNMLIADDQHATEIILKDGKPLKFDDIGDMFVWTKENGKDNVAVQYVRDYHTKEWIKIEEAAFVYDKSFKTPMAYGVFSFKDNKQAEMFIEENKSGKLMTLKDLETHHWERNMDMMKDMKKHHGEMNPEKKQGEMN